MTYPKVEVNGETVWLVGGHICKHQLDAEQAWDLGDDLMIAATRIWLTRGRALEEIPPHWDGASIPVDHKILPHRHEVTLPAEMSADLRDLANRRGVGTSELIRDGVEMVLGLAGLESTLVDIDVALADWESGLPDVDVAQDGQGEREDEHTEPTGVNPAEVDSAGSQGQGDHREETEEYDHGS